MAPRLKVFSWSDGFHVFTVATSSRAKALKAWGSSQDLFATGLATEVFEGADHSAALAAPGEVMQRGLLVDTGAIKVRPAQATEGKQSTKAQQQKVEVLVQALEALDQAHYLAERSSMRRPLRSRPVVRGQARRMNAHVARSRSI